MPKQGQPKKPTPPIYTIDQWAEEVTDEALLMWRPQHRKKLPREVLVRLAKLCFNAQRYLAQPSEEASQEWNYMMAVFHAARGEGFGPALDFMANVRKIWFKAMGADRRGVLPPGPRRAMERTVKLLLLDPYLNEWLRDETIRNGTEPKDEEIGLFIKQAWRMDCPGSLIAKARHKLRSKYSKSA